MELNNEEVKMEVQKMDIQHQENTGKRKHEEIVMKHDNVFDIKC